MNHARSQPQAASHGDDGGAVCQRWTVPVRPAATQQQPPPPPIRPSSSPRSAAASSSSRSTSAWSTGRACRCAASTPADFTVTVGGKPRRVVTAEFVELGRHPIRSEDAAVTASVISTNEGGGVGRLFVFVVDQNTLEPGSADASPPRPRGSSIAADVCRSVGADADAGRTERRLHVGARSREGRRCCASPAWAGRPPTGNTAAWPKRATSPTATMMALRTVGERECGAHLRVRLRAAAISAAPAAPAPRRRRRRAAGPAGRHVGGGGGGGAAAADAAARRRRRRGRWRRRRRRRRAGVGALGGSTASAWIPARATCRCRPKPRGATAQMTRSRASRRCGK